jgi:hypothetical protein
MSARKSSILKNLRSRKARLETEVGHLRIEYQDIGIKLRREEGKLAAVNRDIESLKTKELVVTEHAILRFLERKLGMNMSQVAQEIKASLPHGGAGEIMDSKIPTGEGCQAVIKDMTVVSIV